MGTIPFPNVAEQAGEVATMPQNALAEYARIAALKQQTSQAQAMAPGQLQMQQQQIEAQKRQFADQDALTKAITQYDPSKHTLADVPRLITSNGGSGQAALQAQQGLIGQRQKLAQLSDEDFAHQQKIADLTQGVHDTVSAAAQENKQTEYMKGLQAIAAAGGDVSKEPPQYPGDAAFAQHLPAIRLHSAIVAEAEKDRELSTKEQEEQNKEWKDFPTLGVALNTQTGETKSVGNGVAMSPAMMESKYVALQQKKNSGQPLSKDDQAWSKGYEHYKTLVPTATVNLQAQLLTPQAKEMAAQLYEQTGQVPGRSPGMTASVLNTAAGGPGGIPNVAANKMQYGAATALQKSAVAGEIGKNITAYNTAIAHANQLSQAADALDNGDVRALNSVGNTLGYQFGSDKVTNFNVIKNALAGEISKVFKGGEATDAEIKAVQEPFSAANSPKQLKGAISNAIHLMNSKRDALQQQYTQGMQGKPNFQGSPQGGGMIRARDPQGKLHEAPAGTPLPQGWEAQ